MNRTGWVLSAALLLVAVSVLGGSAIWQLSGSADAFAIRGRAGVVRALPEESDAGWPSYGGDPGGSRYSGADQVTPKTVKRLAIAWSFRTGALKGRAALADQTAFETTPILVDGRLIFCTQFNEAIALDPGTGKLLWRFDPRIRVDGRPANQFTCRGLSLWKPAGASSGPCSSRLFMGTVDARLIALDPASGRPCADFGNGGTVTIEPSISLRWPGEFQITSAPGIVGDVVVTGSAIGDNLRTDAPLGTVHAFDTRTGALRWRFNPLPELSRAGGPARAAHANVWSTIAVDEKRGWVFLPTSSPSPDYFGGNRPGSNRFANSVVALDGATGRVIWDFQTVHHDLWDYDVPAQPGLYQVWRGGRLHDVVAQVTKTGLVFVLDRDTGRPFLPIEERAVPKSDVAGEVAWPTQPFPVVTPPLVRTSLRSSEAFGLTLWDRLACRNAIAGLKHEGLFTPPSEQGTLAYPFTGGGANWGSAAYDPSRNLLIVNMSNIGSFVRLTRKAGTSAPAREIEDDAEFAPMEGTPFTMERAPLLSPLGLPCTPPPWGVLAAVNLGTGKIVWRRALGTTEDLAPGGLAFAWGTPNLGGPIVTRSGLIFIGATMDDYLRAFDVATGEELWKGRLPAGGQATPMTYSYKGRQYIVIAAGGHGSAGTRKGDHLIAFALPGG